MKRFYLLIAFISTFIFTSCTDNDAANKKEKSKIHESSGTTNEAIKSASSDSIHSSVQDPTKESIN